MPVKDAAITETWRQCSAFSRALHVTVTALHLSGSDTVSTGPTVLISLAFAPTPANVAVFFCSGLSYGMVSAGSKKFKHPYPFMLNHLQLVMLLMEVF